MSLWNAVSGVVITAPCANAAWVGTLCDHAGELVATGHPLLVHPSVMALLHWKWDSFAGRWLRLEAVLYTILVACASIVVLMVQQSGTNPNEYDGSAMQYV